MQFDHILLAALLTLVSAGFLFYALGAPKIGKSVFIALATGLAAGAVAAMAVMAFCLLLFDMRAEWAGIALFAFMIAGGIGAAVLAFFVALGIALKKTRAPISPPRMRPLWYVLSGVFMVLALGNLYVIIPRAQPTPKLVSDAVAHTPDLFEPARRELTQRGDEAVPEILRAAQSRPDIDNAYVYPRILGDIPGQASSDALLVLLESPNPQIRAEAAGQLCIRQDRRALEKVLQLLSDPALNDSQKARVINDLAAMGEPSVVPRMPPPSPEMSQGSNEIFYNQALVGAMGALRHPQAYEFLVGLHQHPSWPVRQQVLQQLVNYPSRQTVSILIEHLDDPERSIRDDVDGLLLKATGLAKDSPGRPYARRSETLKAAWQKWLDENSGQLPDQPSF